VVAPDVSFDFPLLKAELDPVDGWLYLTGFRIWGSNAKEWAGLGRLRFTGKPADHPINARSSKAGLLVQFHEPLILFIKSLPNAPPAVEPAR
jgi:hypothetical protein